MSSRVYEFHLQHGWGLNATSWSRWLPLIAERFGERARVIPLDRGYFGNAEQGVENSSDEENPVRITVCHSLGLHTVPSALLDCDVVAILGGFLHFHTGDKAQSIRSRRITHLMRRKLAVDHASVLRDFLTKCRGKDVGNGLAVEHASAHGAGSESGHETGAASENGHGNGHGNGLEAVHATGYGGDQLRPGGDDVSGSDLTDSLPTDVEIDGADVERLAFDLDILDSSRFDPLKLEGARRVIIVHGEADSIVPVDRARELKQALPAGTLVTMSGASHLLPLEFPNFCLEVIAKHCD